MVPCRALIFVLASSLALSLGCGDDAGSSDDTPATDDSKATDDDTGGERVDASVNKPDGSTRKDAGSAADASKPVDDAKDAGSEKDAKVDSLDAATGGKSDASVDTGKKDAASGSDGGNTSAPGQCNDATPHGCYTPLPGNHPMCPAQSPEQSSSYPPMNEWKGCGGVTTTAPFTLDQDAKCAYKGPAGEVATCLCDTDLHWVCGCGGSAIGPWPVCTP